MAVDIAFTAASADEIEMSMTITMKVSEWKRFKDLINDGYPGWKVSGEISRLVEVAERNFGSVVETQEALAAVRGQK